MLELREGELDVRRIGSDESAEIEAKLLAWAGEGRLKNQIDVVEGLENAPDALARLFTGENLGKQLIKVADSA